MHYIDISNTCMMYIYIYAQVLHVCIKLGIVIGHRWSHVLFYRECLHNVDITAFMMHFQLLGNSDELVKLLSLSHYIFPLGLCNLVRNPGCLSFDLENQKAYVSSEHGLHLALYSWIFKHISKSKIYPHETPTSCFLYLQYTLGIQSYSQMMIRASNQLLSIVYSI